jgi:hypothetical protein
MKISLWHEPLRGGIHSKHFGWTLKKRGLISFAMKLQIVQASAFSFQNLGFLI